VEVWVCGQSVIRGGNPLSDVLPGIRIAQSAMTFNINRPADGWTAIGVY
jgi:intracellular sulfur oxidation DsrE/DsrF family protein